LSGHQEQALVSGFEAQRLLKPLPGFRIAERKSVRLGQEEHETGMPWGLLEGCAKTLDRVLKIAGLTSEGTLRYQRVERIVAHCLGIVTAAAGLLKQTGSPSL
jgi:hypothetical protein